jgi:hypothetical protein
MEYENYSLLQLIALFKHTNTYLGCMLKKKHIIDYINRYNIYLETAKEDNETKWKVYYIEYTIFSENLYYIQYKRHLITPTEKKNETNLFIFI